MTRLRRTFTALFILITALTLSACAGGGAGPRAGSEFSGELTIQRVGSNARALGGTLTFTISEDGSHIAELAYELEGDVCTGEGVTVQGTGQSLRQDPPPQITDGSFVWSSEGLRVDGAFTSATRAEGTLSLALEKEVDALGEMVSLTCDFGRWSWVAEAE